MQCGVVPRSYLGGPMSSFITYNITMGTGLALSVDPSHQTAGSQLVLNTLDLSSGLQRWSWIFYPGSQASILYNPYIDMYAAPTGLSKGAAVILFASPTSAGFGGANTWQVLGMAKAAVRPPQNTDLNLNAFGDSWAPLTTKVGIYTWDGGAPNEIWTSMMVPASTETR